MTRLELTAILMALTLIAGALWTGIDAYFCDSYASAMHIGVRYGVWSGCEVRRNGEWLPL